MGVLAILLLVLGACSNEPPQVINDEVAVSTTPTPDAAPTTSSPPADADPTTEAPETTSSDATVTTTEPARAAPPSPSPPPPLIDPCAADEISSDIFGYAGGVVVFECESGWTYANGLGDSGDTEFIAEQVDGTWVHVVGMGSPTCREELLERGAPQSVLVAILPCDVMYPPEQGAPPPPSEECTIQTELYGPTSADLYLVTCAEARNQWSAAATGNPGSWDAPVSTPAGWECWVAPYDPGGWVAGSCYGPEGELVVLNL